MGKCKHPLSINAWGDAEREAAIGVINNGNTTMGEETARYEYEFADYFKHSYVVAVNSGSSANLLMIAAQTLLDKPALKRGDRVLVPAMGWATTYSPLLQYGLIPVFVDVKKDDLTLDLSRVSDDLDTKATLAVTLLGNSVSVQNIEDTRGGLVLIDNCEGMGSEYVYDSSSYRNFLTDCAGQCTTYSSFFSHHISTMEGGLIATEDEETYHTLLALRAHGWTRGQPKESRFYGGDTWEFVIPGYNVRPLEIASAVGRVQLKRLPEFIHWRQKNYASFKSAFEDIDEIDTLRPAEGSNHFGFAFKVCDRLTAHRDSLRQFLEAKGIETRPVISGNFLRHPVIKYYEHEVIGDTPVADAWHFGGIMIGNHGQDCAESINYTAQCVKEYLGKLA